MHPDQQPIANVGLEFTGVLLRHAEARSKILDGDGRIVPVLVMDIETDTAMHMPLHVEQLFPAGAHAQAEAAARRYRKGQRITVQAPVLSARLAVTADHIHTINNNESSEGTHA